MGADGLMRSIGSTGLAALRWAPWAFLAVAVVGGLELADPVTGRIAPTSLLVWIGIFFGVLIVRLLLALRAAPGRTAVFVSLLAGLLLWLGGSYVVSISEASASVAFPGQGEWLFLSACVCFAAFVFLDAQSSAALRSATAWIDAAILAGGAAAVAAAVVLPPVSRAYPDSGVALLTALIYPVVDFGLALLVIAQWALGARAGDRRTVMLVAGFVVFTVADTTLVLNLPGGTYSFTYVADLLWALAFALLVEAACTRGNMSEGGIRRKVPRFLLMAGFAVALVLLIVRPPGVVGLVIALSSAVVIAAGGFRLLLALGTAEAASDALRLGAVDDLTGLPNRRALLHRIEDVMAVAGRTGVLMMDVDDFQEVNDALGHSTGDYVIRVLAGRISEVAPQGALLARTDGDEFAIAVAADDPVVLVELGSAIRSIVGQPIGLDGLDVSLRVSVGISWLLPDDVHATDVLRRADVALYSAWETGSGVEVYRRDDDPFSRERLELANDLRDAVRQRHLIVWYQPSVHATTGVVESLEALVRWRHPRDGMIAPAQFLPLARREGLMLELSKQVVDIALADLAAWRSAGLNVSVSINVAPTELHAGVLAEHVLQRAKAAGLDPREVTLEVSEDSFRIEPDHARRALLEAAAAGLRTSIDDYGAGFNSLAYLRDLPVAEVKLDRSFFAAVVSDPRSAVIISSTVALAHALGMKVVAEGVETQHAASRAIVLGVDSVQGYYLSRPLPAAEVPGYVASVAIG